MCYPHRHSYRCSNSPDRNGISEVFVPRDYADSGRMVGKREVIDGQVSSKPSSGIGWYFAESKLFQRFFLTFSLFDVPYIYEGSSRRMFTWELGGPDSAG